VRRPRGTEGSIGLELALIAPVLFLLVAFIVGIGRIAEADGRVEAAARDAARAASLATGSAGAQQAASVAGQATLLIDGLTCADSAVDVTSYADDGPGGAADRVVVDVACTASLGDISVPGMPGKLRLEASSTAPLDPYRSR
jgi:Flp pilus assembly protein TadG